MSEVTTETKVGKKDLKERVERLTKSVESLQDQLRNNQLWRANAETALSDLAEYIREAVDDGDLRLDGTLEDLDGRLANLFPYDERFRLTSEQEYTATLTATVTLTVVKHGATVTARSMDEAQELFEENAEDYFGNFAEHVDGEYFSVEVEDITVEDVDDLESNPY